MSISITKPPLRQPVSPVKPQVGSVNFAPIQATNPHPFDTKTWAGQAAYVQALFGEWAAKGQVWTAGMPTVEGANREWFGAGGLGHLERAFPKMEADLYVAIGLMGPDAKARGNRNVVAQPLLIVDDIGTKIDPAKWDAQFKAGFPLPTAKVETSPGNQTWIWSLAGDAMDPQRWVDLACVRAWLVELGLTDDVMDPARYIRLPGGWNSKKKYVSGNGGKPVEVSLAEWNECRASEGGALVDLEVIGSVLLGGAGADWPGREFPQTASGRSQASSAALGGMMGAGALVRSADLAVPDPLMKMAQVIGMNLTQIRPGVVEGLCPNIAAHGDRADTGFAFLGDGLMHCNHASCQELSTRDFRSMMEAEFDRLAGISIGLGLGGLDGCATGIGFMAREAFAGAEADGSGGGGGGGSVEDVTGPMVARTEARIAQYAADLDGLVDRFAWINDIQVFFDRATRKLVPKNDVDTTAAVLAVMPTGATGAKRACNQMLNHAGVVHLDGVIRAGGDAREVVDVVNPEGMNVRLANIWRGSRFVSMGRGALRKRYPKEWMALLEWVIPDRGYREWLIDWVAFGFQFPGVRRMTLPVLVGGQGIGKDVIFWAVKLLHGFNNVATLEAHQIGKDFNAWAQNDLVILTELKFGADGKAYNAVKGLLANPEDWVTINPKYGRDYKARVSFSMAATTNNMDALQGLEPDDRRLQPYLSGVRKNTSTFYRFNAEGSGKDEALEGMLEFLLARDLSGFDANTPAPEAVQAKTIMATENLTGAALWARQSVQPGGQGRFEGRNLLTLAEVETAALADPSRRISGNVDARILAKGLRTAGWVSAGQIGPLNDRVVVWLSPGVQGFLTDAKKKDVWVAYKAERAAADAKILQGF